MKTNAKLDKLVQNKTIESYVYAEVDENGVPGRSKFCNSEILYLNFVNGESLKIEMQCSGASEDLNFDFS
jgi:hypothetical protein